MLATVTKYLLLVASMNLQSGKQKSIHKCLMVEEEADEDASVIDCTSEGEKKEKERMQSTQQTAACLMKRVPQASCR